MTEKALTIPDGSEYAEPVSVAVALATEATITTDEGFAFGAENIKVIKARKGEIDDAFDGTISGANKLHKGAIAKKKEFWGPLDTAERLWKRKMGDYRAAKDAEEARVRREEEARLRQEAEDQRIKDAELLLDEGRDDEAEQVLEAPPAPIVVKAAPKVKVDGVSVPKTYKARVTDLSALVAFVARTPGFLHFLTADQSALNQYARSTEGQCKVGGVVFEVEHSVRVRG